jgi:hypothetical protein
MDVRKLLLVGIFLSTFAAHAQEINYNAISAAGFGDVARLLREMTPEQREAVLQQAAIKQQELQRMSPAEVEKLREQLRASGNTIEMEKIDPSKLDPNKSKSAAEIQNDLQTYQDKYQRGQIRNEVVKPAPGQ